MVETHNVEFADDILMSKIVLMANITKLKMLYWQL